MPSGIMDQRHASTTSGLFKEIHKLSEGQTGFPKQKIMPDQHVTLSTEDVLPHQYGDTAASCYKPEEPLVTPKEVEVQSIINLLPDEDDLFSGIHDKLRCGMHSRGSDDEEDFDLFQSGGGMELEVDNCLNLYRENSSYTNGVFNGGRSSNGSVAGKHPYGQHSSRTLFVGNINSNLEDSELKTLFEQYGDIRTLYTACKHRGFVVISYYDIRAAWNVMTSLQNKHLDIHYSLPKDNPSEKNINLGILVIYNLDSSVSNDELCQILGRFGEIKEIGKSVRYHNFIEFYDIRAAEAAYCALNGSSIGGKQIKLELRHPGGERQSLMQQFSPVSTHGNLNDNSVSEQIEALTATGYPAPTTTSCISDPSVRGGHSKNEMAVGSLKENALSHGSFSVPNSFRMRMPTIFNQFGLHELRNSLDQVKSSSQRTPSYHIHSLPGKYDGSANVENLAVDVGPRILEGTNNSQKAEHHGGVFGSSWTSGYPFHGGDYVPRNSKSFHHLPTNPLVWTNSLPYINGINARCAPKLPALPSLPSHVMNTGSHSPPAANPPVYMGESSEAIGFPMESFRRNFRSGSSDLASHNFLPDGNSSNIFLNSALGSPQRTWNNLPGVNFVASAPTSLYTPKERMMRNLLNCRGEAESCNADKIKYELDIDRVLREEDTRTTLMIKNIPNKYTSKMLLATIDEEHRGTYDFIYLPIDFKNKCNMGYAFINMSDPLQIIPFHKTFNGKRWEKFNSGKVATLSYARIQGKAALIAHFQNSSLMNEDKRCRPLLFCTDGPNAGDQEPFPLGSNIRSRSSKPRSSCNEESHNQASLSSGTNFLTVSMTDSSFERNY